MNQEHRRSVAHELAYYVGISYGFSWAFWLPQVFASNNLIGWNFLIYLCGFIAPFGPFVSALCLTYLASGAGGVTRLLERLVELRFPKRWLAVGLFLFPVWAGSAFLVGALTANTPVGLPWLSNPISLLFGLNVYNFAYMFVFVGIAEEFGW